MFPQSTTRHFTPLVTSNADFDSGEGSWLDLFFLCCKHTRLPPWRFGGGSILRMCGCGNVKLASQGAGVGFIWHFVWYSPTTASYNLFGSASL
ncbi:uncharacterized protein Dsimw501_GD28564 [Drosophila simulans]|uniref:Uncharacterized protein n=1 Tax=Drosophila simulans TaxID=7240 RepID=A0A0J9RLI0_DROSI|nr:uncharacterized protein Dsimw501_GD28564 [Drosophila simulans]